MHRLSLLLVLLVALAIVTLSSSVEGGKKKATGTACIVKGSYCNCHYCKCEKGHIHCGKHGKGKKYCYGSMEGEYCHCDYCKCKHGYGFVGYGDCGH